MKVSAHWERIKVRQNQNPCNAAQQLLTLVQYFEYFWLNTCYEETKYSRPLVRL